MRRLLVSVLAVLLLVSPVVAQQQLNVFPIGIVNLKAAATTVANTTVAATIYTFTVPRQFFEQFRQPMNGAAALHLNLQGTITTTQGSTAPVNVGCNFGGTTASIALVNGASLSQSLVAAPLILDVWVRQQGTGQVISGMLQIASASTTSDTVFMASTTGTTPLNAPQTLACSWMWGSAATTNTVTFNQNGVLAIGP